MTLPCGPLPIVNYKKNSGKKKRGKKLLQDIHFSPECWVFLGQHTTLTPSLCVQHNGLTNSNPSRRCLTLQKGFIQHTHRPAQKQSYGLQREGNNYIYNLEHKYFRRCGNPQTWEGPPKVQNNMRTLDTRRCVQVARTKHAHTAWRLRTWWLRVKGVSSPTRSATYDPFSSPVLKSNLTHTDTFVLFKIICMASQAPIYFCGKQCANSNKPHQ